MAYKALYRTYRPLSFSEVAGQQHIVKTLNNALAQNKVAHAYLFTGPRGTGKTTMARLMAKALNCEEGLGHQCNKCENCIGVNDGSHPDVIEIDGASNNGVEEVRDLIERVKYSPIKGRYKVYIIDEVHMITPQAFNALLKTLEEPPAHVVFILATTEPHKVLPTIVSRCQRYDFSKVNDLDIKNRIDEILKIEKIDYEPEAIQAIISLADGGVRDALSILDQVIAYSGSSLKESDILELFGLARLEDKISLLRFTVEGNTDALLKSIDEFSAHGVDFKRLTSDLLDILKDLLINLKSNKSKLLNSLEPSQAAEFINLMGTKKVIEYLDALMKTQADYRFVANIRSLFEITLLKLASSKEVFIKEKTAEKVELKPVSKPVIVQPKAPIEVEKPAVIKNDDEITFTPVKEKTLTSVNGFPKAPPMVVAPIEVPSEDSKVFDEVIAANKIENKIEMPPFEAASISAEGHRIQIDDENIINIMVSGLKDDKKILVDKWDRLGIYSANPNIGKFASLLKDGRPYVLCTEVLILEYDLQTMVDKINLVPNQKTLQEIIKSLLGKTVIIYALTRAESVRLKKRYLDLSQINKLPHRKDVTITVQGLNV